VTVEKWFHIAESHLLKKLADKRKEIKAYIGSLEADLEQARRDLSAIVAIEKVFQACGPSEDETNNHARMRSRDYLNCVMG